MEKAWLLAGIGGVLIGLAATLLLLFNGRICGISGIFFGGLRPQKAEWLWRVLFLVGLIAGGLCAGLFIDDAFLNLAQRPLYIVMLAGFAVGFGTRLGSGCTSGHGVCGISRLSFRSVVATCSFILAGALTVALMNFFWGKSL